MAKPPSCERMRMWHRMAAAPTGDRPVVRSMVIDGSAPQIGALGQPVSLRARVTSCISADGTRAAQVFFCFFVLLIGMPAGRLEWLYVAVQNAYITPATELAPRVPDALPVELLATAPAPEPLFGPAPPPLWSDSPVFDLDMWSGCVARVALGVCAGLASNPVTYGRHAM